MIPTLNYYVFTNRVNKRGETSVFLRFTKDRKSSYVNTKIKVPVRYWDQMRQRLKPGYSLATITNVLLEKKMLEVKEKLLNEAMHKNFITSRKAKETIVSKQSHNFFVLVDQYMNDLNLQGKIGTIDKSKSIFVKFEKFLGSRNISLHDIDEDTLNRFQNELREKYKNKTNTIHSNLKTIRRIFSIAVRKKIITSDADPFKGYELRTEKTNRDFLTEDELKRIANLDLKNNSRLEKYRNIFIWTTISGGLRISDVALLQKRNIDDGCINLMIRKTNTPHRIKLSGVAFEMLNKYLVNCNGQNGFIFDMVPPNLDTDDQLKTDRAITSATASYNLALKEIMKMAQIDKQISSHSARITFISLAINMGIDIKTVQNIATHSDLKMTSRYAKNVDTNGGLALERFSQLVEK
jgi:integrase/recombinase XerD